jgi:hypothetical protein
VLDIILGVFLVSAALLLVVALVLWSRRTIDEIARRRLRSAREVVKGLNHE